MFFKNKETGLVWEVVDPDHIKRCQNDSNYEEVEVIEENEEKENQKPSSKKSSSKSK